MFLNNRTLRQRIPSDKDDMDIKQKQEQYSNDYDRAVAAGAGYSVQDVTVDDDSIDLNIKAGKSYGHSRRPQVDVQMKCTYHQPYFRNDGIHLPLKRKNYEDLTVVDTCVPRILIVVSASCEDSIKWLDFNSTDMNTTINGLGYWLCIQGAEKIEDGQENKTVILPKENEFNIASLVEIMRKINRKESLR